MKQLTLTLALTAVSVAATAADHPPMDHAGANLTLANGDIIWGEHTNINVFSVPGGAKVLVAPFDGNHANPVRGSATVHARVVIIAGELDATGSGYSGGGGGGGGAAQLPSQPGQGGKGRYLLNWCGGTLEANPGNPGDCGLGCPYAMWGGSGEDGDPEIGGESEAPDTNWLASCGGYGVPGANGDSSTNEVVRMGGGGAGARGGEGNWPIQYQGGYGGASGGSGGGAVSLFATELLEVREGAVIRADGTMGRGRVPSLAPENNIPTSGANGSDAWPPEPGLVIDTTNWFRTGGAGAGGGILLKCMAIGGLRLAPDATISTLGGGASRLTVNGGTVKLFYSGADPTLSGVTIEAGRLFKGGAAGVVPGWTMYE